MRCSIVIATKNKAPYLLRVLESIFSQKVPFEYDVIVVDDGATDCTHEVCERFDVQYIRVENAEYRNPSVARNVGYRAATGEIIIAQSDEVIHKTPNAIELLCTELQEGEFLLATVYNYFVESGKMGQIYTGNARRRPFFFLGCLWRKDLYAVGGNDEEFTGIGYDDDWFADCLIQGQCLKPRFLDDVIGLHQDHVRPNGLSSLWAPSKDLYEEKKRVGMFESSGGPWEWWEPTGKLSAMMVVPCKNRLPLLRQALPLMLEQTTSFDYKVVVVDYGCPEGTFEYCCSLRHPRLLPMRVLDNVKGFSHSRSRNCGVVNTESDVVVFMDCDVMLRDGWLESAVRPILDGHVICTCPEHPKERYWKGLSAVRRDVFMGVQGFDEYLKGWGYEDYDLFDRVSKCGPVCKSLGAPHIEILPHSDELRFLYQDVRKNYAESDAYNKEQVEKRSSVNPYGFGLGGVMLCRK